MNAIPSFSLGLLCLLALLSTMLAGTAPPAALPASLEAPAHQALAFALTGRGVQIYECRAVPGEPNKFEWAFKAPEADLFNAQGQRIGRHFAGPTWELTDGSKVVGRVTAKADAPDGKGIPWLSLEAVQASGATLSKVQTIQRVDTTGGKAPLTPADSTRVGQEARVEYTATYKFYVPGP